MASRLITMLGMALAYVQPVAYRCLAIMTDEDTSTFASWPTLTGGSGVPSEAQPNGSVYFRTNGSLYRRAGGAWVAGSTTGAAATGVTAAGAATGAEGTGASGSSTTGVSAVVNGVIALGGTEALGVIAAKNATVRHAGVAASAANDYPGPFVAVDRPRNVVVTFGVGWDGGDVTVTGNLATGIFGSEVFTSPGIGGGTVVGAQVFIDVQAAAKASVGASAAVASLGTGDKIFTPSIVAGIGFLTVDGVADAGVFDATNKGFTPTTLPNGARTYVVYYARNTDAVSVTDPGHTHTGPSHTHTAGAITVTDPTHSH